MIEIRDLTKKFDDFTAVDHLDLTIQTGEFFGLLGPNGAGKTTTISMMSTVLLPTEGEILIDGCFCNSNYNSAVGGFTYTSDGTEKVPRPCWVSTRIPSLTGVTQVRVFGIPSTIIMQSVHRPIAQKMPRGS